MTAQSVEGYLNASDVKGPRDTPPIGAPPLDPRIVPGTPQSARTRMMGPFVGGSIELMTPALLALPARPRAYAHVDVSYVFGPDYIIPKIGDPGPFIPSPNVTPVTERTVLGQGGTTTATILPLMVSAGAGIAFTLELWERALRIKPSFEYLRQEVHISGLVRKVVADSNSSTSLGAFREITLAAERTVVYHGIGPGLELELDTRRAGPFVLSLYLAGKGWSILDNEKEYVFARNEYNEDAEFYLLSNKWAFAGALGLRFRWVPE